MTTTAPYRIVDDPSEQKFLLYFGDYTVGEFLYGPSARDVVEPHARRAVESMNRSEPVPFGFCYYCSTTIASNEKRIERGGDWWHASCDLIEKARAQTDETRKRAERAEAECERLGGERSTLRIGIKTALGFLKSDDANAKRDAVTFLNAALSPAPAAGDKETA